MTGWARAAAMGAALMLGAATSGSARTDQDTYESLRAEAFEAAQWAIASDAADALAKVSARFAQAFIGILIGAGGTARRRAQHQRGAQRRRPCPALHASSGHCDAPVSCSGCGRGSTPHRD